MLEVLMEEGKFWLGIKFLWSYLEGAYDQIYFQIIASAVSINYCIRICPLSNLLNMLNILTLNFKYIEILDFLIKQWIMTTTVQEKRPRRKERLGSDNISIK